MSSDHHPQSNLDESNETSVANDVVERTSVDESLPITSNRAVDTECKTERSMPAKESNALVNEKPGSDDQAMIEQGNGSIMSSTPAHAEIENEATVVNLPVAASEHGPTIQDRTPLSNPEVENDEENPPIESQESTFPSQQLEQSNVVDSKPKSRRKQARISSVLLASGNIAEKSDDGESSEAMSEMLPRSSPGALRTGFAPTIQATSVTKFKDHFSLDWPSSTIRYRSQAGAARVVETDNFQIILEESSTQGSDGEGAHVLIRRVNETSLGVRALRCIYAIVTTFWTGTLLVFSCQVLLLVFVHLAIEFGLTGSDPTQVRSMGAILCVVPFLRGFAHLLALAGAFVVDTFRGHHLIRQVLFSGIKKAAVEWIFFLAFLGLPVFVLCIALLSKTPRFWEITGVLWSVCAMIMYLLFVVSSLYHEVSSFKEVIQKQYPECTDSWSVVKKAIRLRQLKTFSGTEVVSYVAIGSLSGSAHGEVSRTHSFKGSYEKHKSLLSRFTMWQKLEDLGLYKHIEPRRVYEIEEARDVLHYVTSFAWSLERVFCNSPKGRSIVVFRGPGAVTRAQLKSTAICALVGTIMVSLVVLSFLVYLSAGAAATVLFLLVFAIVGVPRIKAMYRIWKAMSQSAFVQNPTHSDRNGRLGDETDLSPQTEEESEGIHITREVYRNSEPTMVFSVALFLMDTVLFFVWPCLTLLLNGNIPLAIMLIFLGIIWKIRFIFDPALVLEETGNIGVLGGASELDAWSKKSRLNTIIEKATRGEGRTVWRHILALLCVVFLAIFAGTLAVENSNSSSGTPFHFQPEWEYIQSNEIGYPSCNLQNFFPEESPLTSLADFAFLAFAPYWSTGIIQEQLDNWFEGMGVQNQALAVDTFRHMYDIRSQVSFNLVTVPTKDKATGETDGQFAYVLIRGSTTAW